MGFSPQTIELEGEKVNVWQVIVGDLEEFKLIKESFLGEGEMPTCERIIVETI